MTNGLRVCKICGEAKPITDFYGKIHTCKKCVCRKNNQKVVSRNLERQPDLQGEVWMGVVGFEGLYKVSNLGRVRSCRRGTIMIPQPLKDGYLRVRLRKEGKDFSFLTHRLVAMAFIPNPNNYDTINHKDFNTQNNCVENLEWCTQKYNNKYSRDAGHYHYSEKAREAAKRNRKISDELAIKIFEDYKKGMKQADLASKYDVTRAFVCRLVHGRCRTERSKRLVEKGLMTIPKVEKSIPQKELYKDEILRLHSEGMNFRKIGLVLGIKGHSTVAEVIKEFKDKNNE